MRIGPLTLWQRMHCNGTPIDSVNVASLHWPWSITWRWGVTKSPYYPPPGTQGWSIRRVYSGQGFNFHVCFNRRWSGHWSLQMQPNMKRK